jgi:hypothetical protein
MNPVNQNPECSICLEPIAAQDRHEIACHHVFHRLCIFQWAIQPNGNGLCPMRCQPLALPPLPAQEEEAVEEEEFDQSAYAHTLASTLFM